MEITDMQVKERNKMHRVKEGDLLRIALNFPLILKLSYGVSLQKEEEDEEERKQEQKWREGRAAKGGFMWLPKVYNIR